MLHRDLIIFLASKVTKKSNPRKGENAQKSEGENTRYDHNRRLYKNRMFHFKLIKCEHELDLLYILLKWYC